MALAAGLTAVWAQPQAPVPTPQAAQTPARPKIALVLSGGGARGFAHVGVLKALEQAQVPVDWIVGTSMGAIVGGLYATGLDATTLERELLKVDWNEVFNNRAPRQELSQRRKEEDYDFASLLEFGMRDGEFRIRDGAVSTRSLETLLRRYTLSTRHLAHFDALPTPFRAVATNMETGGEVVFERGDLALALRASMSVPGLFAPVEVDDTVLGDGGLVNNLPVDVARQLGADVVIAVNIGTPLAPRDTLRSLLGVTAQMINILTEQNVQRSIGQLTRHDLLLLPPLGSLTSADFVRAQDIIDLGHDYGATIGEALARFAVDGASYRAWQLSRSHVLEAPWEASTPQGRLGFVRIDGVPQARQPALLATLESQPGGPLGVATIERDVLRLVATDDYSRVDYQLVPAEGLAGEGLVLRLDEKAWGPNYFRIGLDLRTDLAGEGGFTLRLSHNRRWLNQRGTEWRNQVQIGEQTGWSTQLFHPLGADSSYFLAPYAHTNRYTTQLWEDSHSPLARLTRQDGTLGLDVGRTLGERGRFGELRAGLFAMHRQTRPQLVAGVARTELQPVGWNEAGVRFSVVSDQLDHANFPQSGYRVKAETRLGHRRVLGQRSDYGSHDFTGTYAHSWGPHTLNAHMRLGATSDLPLGALEHYALGGFQQMSGYRVGELVGSRLLFTRLAYYQRLPVEVPLARGLFVGGSLELGNAWQRGEAFNLRELRTGASLFVGADTGLGPLYLGLVYAPRGYTGLYLFLGRP